LKELLLNKDQTTACTSTESVAAVEEAAGSQHFITMPAIVNSDNGK
jgi:hypothetical protein